MRMVRQTLAHLPCALVLLALAGPDALLAQYQKYEGQTVLNIQFEPKTQPLEPSELPPILPLRQDQPLRMADVRRSIERLFSTGRYADIQVDAQPYNDGKRDGVIVRFITTNSWFIGNVTVAARLSSPPRPTQLESISGLDLGQPYTESKLQLAVADELRLLETNGLFLGHIQPFFEHDDAYQQINIRFDIASGPRARFTTPLLLGDFKLSPERILTAAKFRRWIIHTWKPMTQTRVQQALEGVRALYQKDNRLEAKVSLEGMKYDPSTNAAQATLRIEAGPRIEVHTIGANIPHRKVERYVPVFEEHAVDRDLLVEGARNLQDFLQSEGYFEAQVGFKGEKRRKPPPPHRLPRKPRSPPQTGRHRRHRQPLFRHRGHPRAHVPPDRFAAPVPARPLQRQSAPARRRVHRQSLSVQRLPRSRRHLWQPGQLSRQARLAGRLARHPRRPPVLRQPSPGGWHRPPRPRRHPLPPQLRRRPALQRIQRGRRPRHHPRPVLRPRLPRRDLRMELPALRRSQPPRPPLRRP